MQNGKVEILMNEQGSSFTPCYIAFTDDGPLIGISAKDQVRANPYRTIFKIK